MRIIKEQLRALQESLDVLQAGKILAHATDTCYSFACDASSQKALLRLYALKQMFHDKPVSILVPDLSIAKRYGLFNKEAKILANKYWPGPLTIVVRRKKTLPSFLNPRTKNIGIRVPAHRFSRKLAELFNRPITTTSANITTLHSTYSAYAIKKMFKDRYIKPDLIIDSGRLKKNPPSTIVDVTNTKLRIIRHGDILL